MSNGKTPDINIGWNCNERVGNLDCKIELHRDFFVHDLFLEEPS